MRMHNLFFAFGLFFFTPMVMAQNGQPSHQDVATFKQIISRQIAAFQNNDADGAFAFAAPEIKKHIGNAQVFMKMVEQRYLPVFRPRGYKFKETKLVGRTPVQALSVDGPQGQQWTAYYFFEKQKDMTWRISGVFLKKQKGVGI